MANDVLSLFGLTAEDYIRQRDKDEYARGVERAKLNPYERASAGLYAGGAQLGRAISGLLGSEDPALAQFRKNQELLQGVDLNDPASLRAAAQKAMDSKYYPAASQLAQRALDVEAKRASIAKDEAAAQASISGRTPADVLKAQRIAALRQAIPQYEAAGMTNEVALLKNELDALLPSDKVPSFGDEAERISRELFKKPFNDLDQNQMAIVNKRVDSEARGRKPDTILPGQPVEPKDWLKFREFIDKNPVYKKATDITSVLPNALEVINMSTSNDIASAALPKALADIAGEGKQTSNADIARYAKTGGLDDRLISSAVGFISGRTTVAKKEQAKQFASAVYRGALMERRKALVSEAGQTGYDQSPNYARALQDIDAELAKFKKPSEMKAGPSPSKATGNPLIDKYLTK